MSFMHSADVPSATGVFCRSYAIITTTPEATRKAQNPFIVSIFIAPPQPLSNPCSMLRSITTSLSRSGPSTAYSCKILPSAFVGAEPCSASSSASASFSSSAQNTSIISARRLQPSIPMVSGTRNLRREIAIRRLMTEQQMIPRELRPPVSRQLIISKLPIDVIQDVIIMFLSPTSFKRFSSCCRALKALDTSPTWQRFTIQYFGQAAGSKKVGSSHWKKVFERCCKIASLLDRRSDQRIEISLSSSTPPLPPASIVPDTRPRTHFLNPYDAKFPPRRV